MRLSVQQQRQMKNMAVIRDSKDAKLLVDAIVMQQLPQEVGRIFTEVLEVLLSS